MIKQLYKSLVTLIERLEEKINSEGAKPRNEIEYYQRINLVNNRIYCALFKSNDIKDALKHLHESYELMFERYRELKGAEKEKLRLQLENKSLLIDVLNQGINFEGVEND